MSKQQLGRNDLCSCGSGKKYKHCCGNSYNRLLSAFSFVPKTTKVYYLDTCVWSEIVSSPTYRASFLEYFDGTNRLAALSDYGLYELSRRSSNNMTKQDVFFREAKERIIIPTIFDMIIEGELNCFPKKWHMKWLPLSFLINETSTSLLAELSRNAKFLMTRQKLLRFSFERFMKLEQLKVNFPPLYGESYTIEEAQRFVWAMSHDYLRRHFIDWYRRRKNYTLSLDIHIFDPLYSIQTQTFFIFYKYYLHGQSPNESDLIDFAQIAYVPYSQAFVTEKNVAATLNHVKKNEHILKNTQIVHFPDFLNSTLKST